MSWTPTDEQVEKGAAAMHPRAFSRDAQWISDETRDRALNEMRRQARAVLVAVGPMVAAQALRDAAEDFLYNADRDVDLPGYADLHDRADTIEKESGR